MLTKVLRSVEGCARAGRKRGQAAKRARYTSFAPLRSGLVWLAGRPHALLNIISRESRLKLKHHFKRTFQAVASPHRRAPAMFAIIAGQNETPLLQRSYIIQIYKKKKKEDKGTTGPTK